MARAFWPTMSTGRRLPEPQARMTAPSVGERPGRTPVRVEGQLVDDRVPDVGVGHVGRELARVAEEERARRPCPRAAGRRGSARRATSTFATAPAARSFRLATVPPSTTVGLQERDRRGVRHGALEAAVDRAGGRSRSGARSTAVSARIVRSEPNPTARSRTLAGSPCSTSSADGRAVAAEEVAADRRREERAARHVDLVRAAGRREDADVDLGGAVGGAGRAADDGDLVDEDVAAAQERAVPVRPDREHADEEPAS